MRFALLGSECDGVLLAEALLGTGRHQLVAVMGGSALSSEPPARMVNDLEELLADPAIELVVVASAPQVRADHLRRSLQSERHVACVHPCGDKSDVAYEVELIRQDTRKLLIPLMPDALNPSLSALRAQITGNCELLRWERFGAVPAMADSWDVLRRLGGEIAEVSALAPGDEWDASKPVVVTGRFASGVLFQLTWMASAQKRDQLTIFHAGGFQEMEWRDWDRWNAMVDAIETAVADPSIAPRPSWQDSIRSMELAEAAKRSIEKRRVSGMDYQEFTEDVGFKGTMTLIGCGMIWLILLLLGISIWIPWAAIAIVPMLVVFLAVWLVRQFMSGSPTATGGASSKR